ncbi:MAG TPA: RsfA family transcriptional regulator [Bacillales bacterium]|nr:RsfA family transcriptional regulator [Bacillales bacterium]
MAKVRQDAWSKEDDLLLADTVLRHVREGSTQLQAFEEVGDKLNRTSAACGFRWNAIVRDQYKQAMEIAKKQRKERKRMLSRKKSSPRVEKRAETPGRAKPEPAAADTADAESLTLNDVIAYLTQLNEEQTHSHTMATTKQRLEREKDQLVRENEDLKKQLAKTKREYETVKEDYQSLIQIMDRARKMVVFGDDESKPAFKMDKNGNLERVAK